MATYVAAGASIILLILSILLLVKVVETTPEMVGAIGLSASVGIGALAARAHRL